MPRADDMLRKMSPATFISSLDCSNGFYQIPMAPESIPLTAFITHRGHFEFTVMPFGLKCAGSTFQRTMDKMLSNHQRYAGAYIDDTSVYSVSWCDHLCHLRNVFQAFRESGMTLKLSKCKFAKSKVKFIGHMVGSGEIAVVESKVDAIKNIPEPRTKKLLRSFLAMCSYYRSFLPSFSDVAYPLTELTKGGKVGLINFTEQERTAFYALKDKLCSSEVLGTPRYDRPFQIQCDASDYAVGCCLSQLDDEGRERPLAFASVKFTEVQRRWSVLEKESYAVVYALRQFDVIVFNSKVVVFTDHNPLTYMVNNTPKSAKATRWAIGLSRYDLEIRHKSGKKNTNADCLSRVI